MAALTPATHHLVGEELLGNMRPGSLLVNVARGPIIDEDALARALKQGTPAIADPDVFETEPLPTSSSLVGLDNVLLTPHCVAWTDEMARGNGGSAAQAIIGGRVPRFVVNREVLDKPANRVLRSSP